MKFILNTKHVVGCNNIKFLRKIMTKHKMDTKIRLYTFDFESLTN